MPHVRLHDLRHLHVSPFRRRGLDPREIADGIWHADPALTLCRYAHIFDEHREAGAVSLHVLLGPQGPTDQVMAPSLPEQRGQQLLGPATELRVLFEAREVAFIAVLNDERPVGREPAFHVGRTMLLGEAVERLSCPS